MSLPERTERNMLIDDGKDYIAADMKEKRVQNNETGDRNHWRRLIINCYPAKKNGIIVLTKKKQKEGPEEKPVASTHMYVHTTHTTRTRRNITRKHSDSILHPQALAGEKTIMPKGLPVHGLIQHKSPAQYDKWGKEAGRLAGQYRSPRNENGRACVKCLKESQREGEEGQRGGAEKCLGWRLE